MGMAKNTRKRGREQAGTSREGRRTMEKVLENTVRDIGSQCSLTFGCSIRWIFDGTSSYSLSFLREHCVRRVFFLGVEERPFESEVDVGVG